MTTLRQDPGWTAAGKGLWISSQCRLGCRNRTLDTCSWQSPTLQIEMVRSALQHAWTPPKNVEPVTASLPDGASPVTTIDAGLAGSLLVMVRVEEKEPTPAGAKRIGTGTDEPGPIDSGYDRTCGTPNSAAELVMSVTDRTHDPLLFRISGSSTNDPVQAAPMFPLPAMARTSRGAGATPDTGTVCGPSRSLL